MLLEITPGGLPMGKVFGILLLVLGIWMASEFAQGTSPFQTARTDGQSESIVKRSGSKVQAAYEEGGARVEALLED
jgi:hypothetical protein